MVSSTKCPLCGKPKKSWFELCFECNEKEKQKPTCDVCGIDLREQDGYKKGFTLCLKHWQEKQDGKKNLKKLWYDKYKKEKDFKEKFEGKYYFNSQRVKSKSELLICYFLEANGISVQYEPRMNIDGNVYPDFVLQDDKGNIVILEHFGVDNAEYVKRKKEKIRKYQSLCESKPEFKFITTTEDDIFNLKESLGKKLDETPLKRALWK
jgi:predicted nuclease of restriction endonuclease-like RecB superfamily